MKVNIVISSSGKETTMNHEVAGGVGCKVMKEAFRVPPPLACLNIATILSEANYDVSVIDANENGFDNDYVVNSVCNKDSVIIVFGSLPTVFLDIELCRLIRKKDSHSKILYVNTIADLYSEQIFASGVSSIVAWDAEVSIVGAVKAANEGDTGIVYRERMSEEFFSNLSFPKWDFLDMNKYSSFIIQSSRGCSMGCPHCPYFAFQNSSIIFRPVEDVIAEMKFLETEKNADYVLFRDPCFTFNKDRVLNFLKQYDEAGLTMKWAVETRIELLDRELIGEMAKRNCSHIRMGVESADENILADAKRLNLLHDAKQYLQRAVDVVKWCKEFGVNTMQFYMIGFSGDNHQTIQKLKEFVDLADPDIAALNYIVPYPGTLYRKVVNDLGLIEIEDPTFYGSKDVPVARTLYLSSQELQNEKEKLENYFEFRKREFRPI